jgi:hypothetical protein
VPRLRGPRLAVRLLRNDKRGDIAMLVTEKDYQVLAKRFIKAALGRDHLIKKMPSFLLRHSEADMVVG